MRGQTAEACEDQTEDLRFRGCPSVPVIPKGRRKVGLTTYRCYTEVKVPSSCEVTVSHYKEGEEREQERHGLYSMAIQAAGSG